MVTSDRCPRISCTWRRLALFFNRWVAHVCRHTCGVTCFFTFASALNVTADELLGIATPKPKRQTAKGKLHQVFESAAKLPRRQQQQIAEVVQALVAQHANGNGKPA